MDHVEELAVDVANDNYWLLDAKHVAFIPVNVGDLIQDVHKTFFCNLTFDHKMLANEFHIRQRFSSFILKELFD